MLTRILATLLFASPLYAFEPPNNTHEYQLDNGLTLIVRVDDRAPIVAAQVWYKIGSTYEESGRTGLSHFLEHMMFKGTTQHPGTSYTDTIYKLGGDLNAFASFDYTGYTQSLPAKDLATIFELEADRMQHLRLDDVDAFEKEKQVILEERRMRVDDQPISLTYERFLATAFTSSPYRMLPIGWHNDIAQTTLDDLRDWYDKWYIPNNAIVIVIGDVDPAAVYQLAQKYFGPIVEKPLPEIKSQHEVTPLGAKRITVKVPALLPYVIIGFHAPVLNHTPVLWEPAALALLASILDGGESARFAKFLTRQQRVAAAASVDYEPFYRDKNLFVISGIPTQETSVAQLEAALLEQIARVQQYPINEQELERARRQFMASEIYKLDSVDSQAYEIGSLESIGLPWQMSDEFVQQILVITPEQVQMVAQKYLNPEYMTVAILEPQALETSTVEQTAPESPDGEIHD